MAERYGKVGIRLRGEYSPIVQYELLEGVSYGGGTYFVHTRPPVGTLPTDANYFQPAGEKGEDGVSIGEIEQVQESTESGGINIIRVHKSDETYGDFNVRNGAQGEPGVSVVSFLPKRISTESGGESIYEMTLSDGSKFNVSFWNGAQGEPGDGVRFIPVPDIPLSPLLYPNVYAVETDNPEVRKLVSFDREGNQTQYGGTGGGYIVEPEVNFDLTTGVLSITGGKGIDFYIENGYLGYEIQ